MNTYSTSNLNLMAYVRRHGLKYIESTTEYSHGRTKVIAIFEDPDNLGSSLELKWQNSKDKEFQDWRIFFRNEIDKTLKENSHAR